MAIPRNEHVTIADVARIAAVSISSVSNVLNGRSSRMRESTRERIQQAIDELGYTPNLAARQLKTGHSPIIGLIVPSVANPFFGFFARQIEEVALTKGYQVLLGNSDRNPDRERRYAEELWGYGVRGMIFGSSLAEIDHLQNVINKGMHVVAFDRQNQQEDSVVIDHIGVDNVQAMRLITKHLIALGHRKIGFISGPIRTVSRLARLEGYRKSLEEAGLVYDETLVWEGAATNFGDAEMVQLGRQGAHSLLSSADPPSAIIAINDMYAFGVYAGVRDLGLKIPADVSITGIDDIVLAEVAEPPLTTVRQPMDVIAKLAVERLVARIDGSCEEQFEHRTLSPKLIVRSSTAEHPRKTE
ncbi:MAG: DNA-binding LacI/PurR family transcriptional regulator [Desulforhopalus sp.]|jgi:DNA-binding LacI/PurR family transcriptional regulator